jgi:hypothetical protein
MKKHYYCFTFIDNPGSLVYASVYAAHEVQAVTLASIAQAKQGARVSQAATLVACSYLGYMTAQEFQGE